MTRELERVLAIANGKGGAGKSTIASHVAGAAAADGLRVLAIDLDSQGDLGQDLGYRRSDIDDKGAGLVGALLDSETALTPVSGVRPNLDVIPGGAYLAELSKPANLARAADAPAAFREALIGVAGEYDLVILDCPPKDIGQWAALYAARHVVIPAQTEPGSWNGLRGIGPIVREIREEINPELDYLGAVIFAADPRATRSMRMTRVALDGVADRVPLFDTVIRNQKATASACRVQGQLVWEFLDEAKQGQSKRLAQLKERQPLEEQAVHSSGRQYIDRLAGLAHDYRSLAREVVQRISAAEAETPEAATR